MRSVRREMYLKPISRAVEQIGLSIASILNDESPSPVKTWVTEVVTLMAEGARGEREFDLVKMDEKGLARLEELFRTIHFKIYPRGPIRRGEWLVSMIPVHVKDRRAGAALMLLELGRAGAMPRFRQCQQENCRAHFFAIRKAQKFCSIDCREEHHRSQPEYKESQRQRVRARYHRMRKEKQSQRRKHGKR